MIEINNSVFSEIVEKNSLPVIVDCFAPWCGPCKMLGKVLETIENEYSGKVVFTKCNIDEEKELAEKFNIRNVPVMLFFKNGSLVNQLVGAQPKQNITKILDTL